MFHYDVDAQVASERAPKKVRTKKRHITKLERERKQRERHRIAAEQALVHELCAEKAGERFDGAIDPVTGIWKRCDDPFDRDELVCLDAFRDAEPRLADILIAAFNRGDWSTSRDLQSYMGRKGSAKARYSGARPEGIAPPDSGYLVRLCIAAQGGVTSDILKKVRITGFGEVRMVRCLNPKCRKPFAALCPPCRTAAKRARKLREPLASELRKSQSAKPPASESTATAETEVA
jgi:hypothetical protein